MQSRRVSRRVVDSDYNSGISECLYWNEKQVADWVEEQGFPQYKQCFLTNCVTGRMLIATDTSALPSMGITDFEDMKRLTKLIRDLIGIPKLHSKRDVAMGCPKVAYLELKRRTGHKMDNTTYKSFKHQHRHFFSPPNKW
ncbi:sterile alpha motif domain-containing protein 15-like [Mizuhopecten yessoensis]|uniref:Sterile alpha motif domain-containing protein 15 n=1 Tax=Mizuhopecten yessoensis TaxID=6573 RepID=A0A210QEN2_MIZYE|nr:sterile alpha motif domain-containing protein 15-like [Mizuhopecten yessoensis]OWF47206.1 Sterile alpha motif domain-containing protein 15 [Mizuhopecten yessoensis]